MAVASWKKEYPGGAAAAEADFDGGLKQVIAPSMRGEAEDLSALPAPAQEEEKVERMLANLSRASEVLAEEGSQGVPKSGIQKFEREAASYGLKACQNP